MRRLILLSLPLLAGIGWLVYKYQAGIAHGLGVDTQGSYNYAFFSGVGPFLLAFFAYTAGMFLWYRRHNCHVHRCWRFGKHSVADGKYTVCTVHHPESIGKITHQHIKNIHEIHLRRTAK